MLFFTLFFFFSSFFSFDQNKKKYHLPIVHYWQVCSLIVMQSSASVLFDFAVVQVSARSFPESDYMGHNHDQHGQISIGKCLHDLCNRVVNGPSSKGLIPKK